LTQTPTANFLRRLLDNVEQVTEKKLHSRESIEQILQGLKMRENVTP